VRAEGGVARYKDDEEIEDTSTFRELIFDFAAMKDNSTTWLAANDDSEM
jgi:hypothetical protein